MLIVRRDLWSSVVGSHCFSVPVSEHERVACGIFVKGCDIKLLYRLPVQHNDFQRLYSENLLMYSDSWNVIKFFTNVSSTPVRVLKKISEKLASISRDTTISDMESSISLATGRYVQYCKILRYLYR